MRVASLIALWPSAAEFAADLGLPVSRITLWKHRDGIPPEHWLAIEEAAKRRAIKGASASDLARRAAEKAHGALPVVRSGAAA